MPPPPPKPEQVFDIADTNKDGIVSLEELAALIGQGNADKLFGKIDTDGDSLISRSEDKAFRSNMLEEMQKNNAENTTDLNKVNSLSQDLQIKVFTEMLSGQNAASVLSSGNSTSLFA